MTNAQVIRAYRLGRPHIELIDGVWICLGLWARGSGLTPRAAYQRWYVDWAGL